MIHYGRNRRHGDTTLLKPMRSGEQAVLFTNDYALLSIANSSCFAIIDKEDAAMCVQYYWSFLQRGHVKTGINGKTVLLHHMVFGKPLPDFDCDHINRDKTDNRKSNLRFVTKSENSLNNSARQREDFGVYWVRGTASWRVVIAKQHGGYYKNKADAIQKAQQMLLSSGS